MKIIDLSHLIHSEIIVYPDDEPPKFEQIKTLLDNGYNETKLTIYSHTGTHIDAPLHMIKGGRSLHEYDIGKFTGNAAIINLVNNQIGSFIELIDLLEYEELIKSLDFIIINTGWSKYWGTDKYLIEYPVLTQEAANWLTSFELVGIGIDAISVDTSGASTYPIHQVFFEKGLLIIENLTNLTAINKSPFIFQCMPLKYENADGSPIRAIGIIK